VPGRDGKEVDAMTLHLTEQELAVLGEILESSHREKLHELHRTDSVSYKALLRQRIALIEELRTRIAQGAPVV
jgi:hypothetical protein